MDTTRHWTHRVVLRVTFVLQSHRQLKPCYFLYTYPSNFTTYKLSALASSFHHAEHPTRPLLAQLHLGGCLDAQRTGRGRVSPVAVPGLLTELASRPWYSPPPPPPPSRRAVRRATYRERERRAAAAVRRRPPAVRRRQSAGEVLRYDGARSANRRSPARRLVRAC